MTHYLIGDIQGCYDSLKALLAILPPHLEKNRLGFAGDLINRGPKSLETLDFLMTLNAPLIVLGNHDLHFLALYFLGSSHFHHIPHTLERILSSPHCKKYVDFLMHQPFLVDTDTFVMVHAGIPPQWSLTEASQQAKDISHLLLKNPESFFSHIYGNTPDTWDNTLTAWDRARYIVNAFTRMRFCNASGKLDLTNKTDTASSSEYNPWFTYRDFETDQKEIYFGHWASLNGQCNHPTIYALDTGCAWGGRLTAVNTEDHKKYTVQAVE